VTLIPGRHLARASSAAHAPAVFEVELGPGATESREAGLSAAYSGASPQAISAMLSDPSRRSEGVSALEPLARFLDVDHVVAILPDVEGARVLVVPNEASRPKFGRTVTLDGVSAAAEGELDAITAAKSAEAARRAEPPWYKKPATWLVGAGVVAAVVGGIVIYGATRPEKTATVTVMSAP
jgi:hypothetical protein